MSDLANYEPATAKFRLKTSSTSWTQVIRPFGSTFIAGSTGSAYNRSGGVVVRGIAERRVTNTSFGIIRDRRAAFALWQPEVAAWGVLNSPHINSTVVSSTLGFGHGEVERPLGGLGLKLHAGIGGVSALGSIAIVGQDTVTDSSGFLKVAAPGAPTYSLTNLGYTPVGTLVEAIGDINGDDLPEILWVQTYGPYAGIPFWYLSPGYTTYGSTNTEFAKPWDIWL